MKTLLPIVVLMSSCTVQSGWNNTQRPDGTIQRSGHFYGSIGSKAKGIENSSDASGILELDDSVSLRNAAIAGVTAYGSYAALASDKSKDALSAATNKQSETTARTAIKSSASVEKSRIAADVEKTKILEGAAQP